MTSLIRNSHFCIRILLTLLVAPNHERAAEEKRGHIRWLRPEYQAKDEGRGKKEESKAEQAEIPGLPSTSSSKLPAPSSKPPSKAPWPKALPDQIRAVRLALETLAVPANGAALAKLFTGARKDRIEAILESLQALGHAQEVEDGRYSA